MPTLGFIGAGPVGTTFGVRLSEKGYTVAAVSDISAASAERFAKLIPGCRALTANQAVADAAGEYARTVGVLVLDGAALFTFSPDTSFFPVTCMRIQSIADCKLAKVRINVGSTGSSH